MAKDFTRLWILWNSTCKCYDTFDSCVVAADTEEEARKIHPRQELINDGLTPTKLWMSNCSGWCRDPKDVLVEELGVTKASNRGKVIMSSFNAG